MESVVRLQNGFSDSTKKQDRAIVLDLLVYLQSVSVQKIVPQNIQVGVCRILFCAENCPAEYCFAQKIVSQNIVVCRKLFCRILFRAENCFAKY